MVIRDDAKIGDIVVLGGSTILKFFQRCSSVYFGVIVGYTAYGNPRAAVIKYKNYVPWTSAPEIKSSSIIVPRPIVMDTEGILERGGYLRENYDNILKIIQENEQSKNIHKSIPIGTQKEVNISF